VRMGRIARGVDSSNGAKREIGGSVVRVPLPGKLVALPGLKAQVHAVLGQGWRIDACRICSRVNGRRRRAKVATGSGSQRISSMLK